MGHQERLIFLFSSLGCSRISIGDKGYIGTGENGTTSFKDFWENDPATDTWTQKADFPGTVRGVLCVSQLALKDLCGLGWSEGYIKNDFWE